jgi:hypothetical protein
MTWISSFWQQSRALTITAALMLVDFLLNLCGLMFDPRIITGAPAWLKPAKFAISTFIFSASIAWLFRYLPDFPKTKRWVGPGLAAMLNLEVGIIDLQAARGITSHFNISTVENATLFAVMGVGIGIVLVLSVWILVALWRQPFRDPAWGWALRLGMLISVLGSASGGLMTVPTADQRAAMAHHERVSVSGAHTVGAPDGGPGLPGVDWSERHGDLRIPHFLGMHALQIIPFVIWLARRKRTVRFVFSVSASYLGLFLLLLWQALRGESIAHPSTVTMMALALWFIATAAALIPLERGAYPIEALHER